MHNDKFIENYLRVTTILYPFSGLASVDAEIVKNAAERGTRVHKICEGIIAGLGEIGVTEDTLGCVESFKKWWSQGHKVLEIEKRFYDDILSITGCADLIVEENDGHTIVDLKTSYKPSKTWHPQGAAYAYLARKAGYNVKSIKFIHLSRKGAQPKIHEYQPDDDLFLAIYKTYKHFFHKEQ